MNAIDLLLKRSSDPLLTLPAPEDAAIQKILLAGMRVPDHGALKPFHFTVVKQEGLQKLSDIFVSAASNMGADQVKLAKTEKMPFRAPLIIIVSTRYAEHEKVPKSEQMITAGCSVHAMQMAAFTLGYGAMWRTGELSYNADVKKALSIDLQDDLVGFLYIGTKAKQLPEKVSKFFDDRVSYL